MMRLPAASFFNLRKTFYPERLVPTQVQAATRMPKVGGGVAKIIQQAQHEALKGAKY